MNMKLLSVVLALSLGMLSFTASPVGIGAWFSDTETLSGTIMTAEEFCCQRTIGYWKTHTKYGPPEERDDTWDRAGEFGEDTEFFGTGQTWYNMSWIDPQGDAWYILAHQYIAAYLNQFRCEGFDYGCQGVCWAGIPDVISHVEELLSTYTPGEVSEEVRQDFIDTAETLDRYNNCQC